MSSTYLFQNGGRDGKDVRTLLYVFHHKVSHCERDGGSNCSAEGLLVEVTSVHQVCGIEKNLSKVRIWSGESDSGMLRTGSSNSHARRQIIIFTVSVVAPAVAAAILANHKPGRFA